MVSPEIFSHLRLSHSPGGGGRMEQSGGEGAGGGYAEMLTSPLTGWLHLVLIHMRVCVIY